MKPVFLIGYMGCGKTTLGEVLARQLGVPFIDLDQYIERQMGFAIIDLFAMVGERRFREIEAKALREVAAMTGVVVGCGGGTPCYSDNMLVMNKAGITVWLTTSPERIAQRLCIPEHKTKRPKINNLPDVDILPLVERELNDRSPYYGQAQLQFDSTDIETGPDTEHTAQRLVAILESLN
ncbi:MAG: AAA family ATPase [Muribaculaceae bacterium]|nr:AAA family ATPase [Muribaculaceae bacterium]